MIDYKFDVQLLIEGKNLSEDAVNEYITTTLKATAFLPLVMRNW